MFQCCKITVCVALTWVESLDFQNSVAPSHARTVKEFKLEKKIMVKKNQVQKKNGEQISKCNVFPVFLVVFYLRLAQGHRLGHFLTRW